MSKKTKANKTMIDYTVSLWSSSKVKAFYCTQKLPEETMNELIKLLELTEEPIDTKK